MKKISLYVMAALYMVAGINHFINSVTYMKIVPPWLGWPYTIVIVSGVFEILFGLLLIPHRTRQIAAWCIISLLIAVFPANIQAMLNYLHHNSLRFWIAVLRLPFQFVLICWAYLFTKPAAGKV